MVFSVSLHFTLILYWLLANSEQRDVLSVLTLSLGSLSFIIFLEIDLFMFLLQIHVFVHSNHSQVGKALQNSGQKIKNQFIALHEA